MHSVPSQFPERIKKIAWPETGNKLLQDAFHLVHIHRDDDEFISIHGEIPPHISICIW